MSKRAKCSAADEAPGVEQLLLVHPELQTRLGQKYCDEVELLPMLVAAGFIRRVRTIHVEVRPLGGDSFKITLDASKPTVGEAKSEIARAQGTVINLQELYRVSVRDDGGAVREDDEEPELLSDTNMRIECGDIVAMAVKDGPPFRCELDLKGGLKMFGPKWVHQLEGQAKPDEWRVMFFPLGNKVRGGGFSSMYLELCNVQQLMMDSRDVEFRLKVINHKDRSKDFIKGPEKHNFTKSSGDYGFREFLPLKDLNNPASGFNANGRVTIEMDFKVTLGPRSCALQAT
jgi:hypothetical protein